MANFSWKSQISLFVWKIIKRLKSRKNKEKVKKIEKRSKKIEYQKKGPRLWRRRPRLESPHGGAPLTKVEKLEVTRRNYDSERQKPSESGIPSAIGRASRIRCLTSEWRHWAVGRSKSAAAAAIRDSLAGCRLSAEVWRFTVQLGKFWVILSLMTFLYPFDKFKSQIVTLVLFYYYLSQTTS